MWGESVGDVGDGSWSLDSQQQSYSRYGAVTIPQKDSNAHPPCLLLHAAKEHVRAHVASFRIYKCPLYLLDVYQDRGDGTRGSETCRSVNVTGVGMLSSDNKPSKTRLNSAKRKKREKEKKSRLGEKRGAMSRLSN